ncbi:MAG: MbnP family protein [Hymenobacter sp.]
MTPPVTTPGEVDLQFSNVAGTKPLALDGTAYATPAGETFTVTTLEYYVTNIKSHQERRLGVRRAQLVLSGGPELSLATQRLASDWRAGWHLHRPELRAWASTTTTQADPCNCLARSTPPIICIGPGTPATFL